MTAMLRQSNGVNKTLVVKIRAKPFIVIRKLKQRPKLKRQARGHVTTFYFHE